jgi:O-antigen/teichoic acid export membrane protein
LNSSPQPGAGSAAVAEKPAHGMLDELKHLFKHTSTYGFGNILGKAVGFFMIPFYTHYLSPADYGTLELLDLSLALMALVLTMWMNASIIRHYYDYDNPKDRNQAVSTILILAFVIGVVVSFGGIHFSRPLSRLILKSPDLHLYVSLIALSFLMTCLTVVSTSYLRAGQRSVFVVSIDLVNLVLTLSLNIYFIAIRHVGVVGVLYSSLIANTLIAVVLTANTIREVSLSFSYSKLRQIVVFGAPLVMTSIAAFTVNFSDRFFLRHFSTIATVGVYALGYKFAFMLSFLVVQPFDMIWQARMYEIAKRGDSGRMFSKFFEYYSVVLVAVAFALSVVIRDVINVISPADFHAAYKVVPVVALAYIFQGMNRYFLTGSYIAKKTLHLGGIGVASAGANIGLNFLLIPRYGIMGAAWATAASFFLMAALAYMVSRKAYAIPYTFSRVTMLIALAAVLYLGSNLITISSLVLETMFKLLFVAAFPVLLYKAGFFQRREVEMAREAAHALAARYRLRAAAASGR